MRSIFLIVLLLISSGLSLHAADVDAEAGRGAESTAVPDPGPDWGSLPLEFIYEGTPPEPEKITPVRGAALCGKFQIIAEDLLVDPKTRGIANVVVTLNHKRRELPKKLPTVVQNLAKKKVEMTNRACRFEPHVGILWTEQTLVLSNRDPDVHNMLGNLIYNAPFNKVLQPQARPIEMKIDRAEKLARDVSCVIHPYMKGWLVVKDHPYAAVSSKIGKTTIAHLPVGEWEFQLWHESAGYLSEVEVNGSLTTGTKGVYRWQIRSGMNKPLRIVINEKVFAGFLKKK